jgi:hypothetical protein
MSPSIVLSEGELADIATQADNVEASTARIDWEPNTGLVELRLYDATGAQIDRQTITSAGREPVR